MTVVLGAAVLFVAGCFLGRCCKGDHFAGFLKKVRLKSIYWLEQLEKIEIESRILSGGLKWAWSGARKLWRTPSQDFPYGTLPSSSSSINSFHPPSWNAILQVPLLEGRVIRPTDEEVSKGLVHLKYCCCSDQYIRVSEASRIFTGCNLPLDYH